jgi:ATP-dependent RNA helicase DDX54/DBP10
MTISSFRYSFSESTSFDTQAKGITFDLGGDDENPSRSQRPSALRWDRKHKRFVKGDGVGADNQKLVKTESGARLPASFRSGVYDEWRAKSRMSMPRVGEKELPSSGPGFLHGKRYRHKAGVPGSKDAGSSKGDNFKGKKAGDGKVRSSNHQRGKPGTGTGIKSVDQVAKERRLKANRVRRSTQPSRKK